MITIDFTFDDYRDFCIIMELKPSHYESLKQFKEFVRFCHTNEKYYNK